MSFCYECFKEYDDSLEVCPYCGSLKSTQAKEPIHLTPGTMLAGRYLIGQAVSSGGFGIIYKAYDTKLERIIAVKEFFHSTSMTRAAHQANVIVSKKNELEFEYRKTRFLAEAKNMAKFADHKSIPNVYEYFEENGTAYIVMELLKGQGLNSYIRNNGGAIDRDFAIYITNEIGEALKSLHAKGIIHCDVAPDNVYICSDKDLKIKLLDLGAAKLSNTDDTARDIITKPGYSPIEQYNNTGIGTWTDVYALGATLYVMLTGVKPEESTDRKNKDTVIPPIEIDPTIPENLSNTVMKAMALDKHMRFKSIDEFLKALNGEKKVLTLVKEKRRRKKNQILGLSAAFLLLLGGVFAVWKSYDRMEAEEYLEEATISVWYAAEEGSTEEAAMSYVVSDFSKKFDKVTVEVRRIDDDKYEAAISEAKELGTLPTLFESTGLDDALLESAVTLEEVLNSEQASKCQLMSKYHDFYKDEKRIPLGFETPVALVITAGVNVSPYNESTFSDVKDFGSINVAEDSSALDILDKNYTGIKFTENDFLSESGSCAVLLTSSKNVRKLKADEFLLGCEWYCAFPQTANASYTYEWSICTEDRKERAAAERMIMWMLGNNYQDKLMISLSQEGVLPLNDECFASLCSGSADFSALPEVYGNYSFER